MGLRQVKGDFHVVRVVLHKEIVMGGTRSAVGDLKDPPVVNCKDGSGMIVLDRNTVKIPPRDTTLFWTGTRPADPLISIGIQKIEGPRRPIIP